MLPFLNSDNLMKKVLLDAMIGITLLSKLTFTDNKRIGTLGHSYDGNTVLFLSVLDERIYFSCASGSACTYKNRMLNDVGIELASVIPCFNKSYDIFDLVRCIAPRPLLIVSAMKTNTRGMQTLLLNKLVHHMQNMGLRINYVIRDIVVVMN